MTLCSGAGQAPVIEERWSAFNNGQQPMQFAYCPVCRLPVWTTRMTPDDSEVVAAHEFRGEE